MLPVAHTSSRVMYLLLLPPHMQLLSQSTMRYTWLDDVPKLQFTYCMLLCTRISSLPK